MVLNDVECKCGGDGLLERMQGAPVDRCGWILQDLMRAMVRSFGLADPADALAGILRRLAQFVVREVCIIGVNVVF